MASSGCCKSNGNSSSSGSSDPADPAEPAKPEAKPVAVPIGTLLKDYKNNEVRADDQYKDKIIETTGKTGDIKKGILDGMYVTVGTGARFEIPMVQCHLGAEEAKKAAKLNKGDSITIRGRVDGLMMHVQVQDCTIR